MSKQRIVKDEIWDDDWFYELDPSEKLVWLFLLTNPRGNIAGIYKLNKKWASQATGLDLDVFKTILSRFVRDEKILDEENWIGLINFHKHLAYRNASVGLGIVRLYKDSTGCPQALHSLWVTLLNSTLLNLSDRDDKSSTLKEEIKIILMAWNRQPDDEVEVTLDMDSREEVKTVAKVKRNYKQVYKIFKEVLGMEIPLNWTVNTTQQKCADNLFTERGEKEIQKALEKYLTVKDQEFCPQISSPHDLDSKWDKLQSVKKVEKPISQAGLAHEIRL